MLKFADALAAGPIGFQAGGVTKGFPILLTLPGGLPSQTRAELDSLDIEQVLLLGGEQAVGAAVVAELQANGVVVRRIGGIDRYDTAALIWELELDELGYDNTHVNLARGDDPNGFADALAFGPHGGKELGGILLTPPCQTVSSTSNALAAHLATLTDGHIAGGPTAVCSDVKTRYERDAGTIGGEITLNGTSFPQGTIIHGLIGSPTTVRDLSVTGCGFNNTHLELDFEGNFDMPLPADLLVGQCNLAFLIDRNDGRNNTQDIPITVTTRPRTLTEGPDLLSATVDAANRVTFTFDESATGAIADADDFHLYAWNGQQCTPTATPSVVGSTVVAQFSAAPLICNMQIVTTASVEDAAVQDVTGRFNPASSVPLKTVTLPAPITNGPDLVSVTNLTASTFARITADFTFDEAIDAPPPGSDILVNRFELIDEDGINAYPGIGTPVVLSGNRTVRVTFDTFATNVPVGQIVRGVAEVGAVRDTTGNLNPLNAVHTNGDGLTDGPDLVSARVSATDQVMFTFDEPVDSNHGPAGQTIDPFDYKLYNISRWRQRDRGHRRRSARRSTTTPSSSSSRTARSAPASWSLSTTNSASRLGDPRRRRRRRPRPAGQPGQPRRLGAPAGRRASCRFDIPARPRRAWRSPPTGLATTRSSSRSTGRSTMCRTTPSTRTTSSCTTSNGTLFPPDGPGVFENDGFSVRFGPGTGAFSNAEATAAVLGGVNDSFGVSAIPRRERNRHSVTARRSNHTRRDTHMRRRNLLSASSWRSCSGLAGMAGITAVRATPRIPTVSRRPRQRR